MTAVDVLLDLARDHERNARRTLRELTPRSGDYVAGWARGRINALRATARTLRSCAHDVQFDVDLEAMSNADLRLLIYPSRLARSAS